MADDDKRALTGEGAGPASEQRSEDDLLGPYWAVMRRLRGADVPKEPTPEERAARRFPGELVIATSSRELVRIQPDGRIIYGPEYTPDETAVTLWEAIARRRADFEARVTYLDMLELHVALLAVADQAYEAASVAVRSALGNAETTEREREALRFRMDMSRRSLETRVHGMIEFCREFAGLRPDLIAMARRTVPGAHGGPTDTQG